MKNSLTSLSVDTLIVHDVPKKFSKKFTKENPDTDADDIILSEVPTEFDQDLTRFFHDRITSTIGSSSAFEIEFDTSILNSKTQLAINEYFETGTSSSFPIPINDSIRLTQDVAKELHSVQTAKNPGGMLLFILCHSNQSNGIAILKVEREEGVRIQRDSNTEGQTTFNVQHIKDLMLTKKTKLFIIVLFYKKEDHIIGYLCDQQQGAFDNREVADFFLKDFLGSKLKEEPQVTTKKFFETTTTFLNNSSLSDTEKLEMHTHLISELTNNAQSINVQAFAQRCLPTGKVAEFMNSISQNHVPTTFVKNTSLIADKIKKVRYEFECGIKILGTEDTIKEKLTFSQLNEGKTKI